MEIKVNDIFTIDAWQPARLKWWQIFKAQRYRTWKHKVVSIYTAGDESDTKED